MTFGLDNSWLNARGKSMLAQAEMLVVIVLAEKITLGMRERMTAKRNLRVTLWSSF